MANKGSRLLALDVGPYPLVPQGARTAPATLTWCEWTLHPFSRVLVVQMVSDAFLACQNVPKFQANTYRIIIIWDSNWGTPSPTITWREWAPPPPPFFSSSGFADDKWCISSLSKRAQIPGYYYYYSFEVIKYQYCSVFLATLLSSIPQFPYCKSSD